VLKIRAGYDIAFECYQNTPMTLMLSVHPDRSGDLLTRHRIALAPSVASRDYCDAFGNICTRLVAPPGLLEILNVFTIADSGPRRLRQDRRESSDYLLSHAPGARPSASGRR
jgi:hypothetical protein